MLKILQARLQQYVNCELPDVQAGFRKGRGTRDQIANIRWIIEKAREFQKNIYCHPACLTFMQTTSCEMLGWMKHKLESGLQGEISTTSDMQMTPPLWTEIKEELKTLLIKVKEESEKAG